MDRLFFRRKRKRWIAILLACPWGLALASGEAEVAPVRSLSLEFDRIEAPLARLDGVLLRLEWPDGAMQGTLKFTAKQLEMPAWGYVWRNLRWQCPLQQGQVWQCDGPIRARAARGLALRARWGGRGLELALHGGGRRLQIHQSTQADAPLRIELVKLPMTWLAPMLGTLWADGRITGGVLEGQGQLRMQAQGGRLEGALKLRDLGLDSRDGQLALGGLQGEGRMQLAWDRDTTRIESEWRLPAGELLLGPLYAQWRQPVQWALRLSSAGQGWRIDDLSWKAPCVLELEGRGQLDPAAEMPLREAQVRLSSAALDQAHAHYLDSLLGSLGFPGLRLGGALEADLDWREGRLEALDLRLRQLQAEDRDGRFGIAGLEGRLALRAGSTAADSEVSFADAHLHGVALGKARLPLRSHAGGVSLRSPVTLALLGGQLHLQRLAWQPGGGSDRIELGLRLEQVALARLSDVLGWPAFAGTLSGELPSVQYRGEQLHFEGGLTAEVFDGQVTVSHLSLERPFGVAPTLAASLDVDGLDLQPLTSAFGFGEISGRLDGHVRDLRLVNWEPVAFDAAFHTVNRRGERRRISQRAVRDLTEVGGGGASAALQGQVMKAFSSFGYNRIGLSCVLLNEVCTMGGVAAADAGGFYIVEGAGVPRVDVIGHRRRVDWPVLLARLKAASQGQAPVIK